VAILKHASATGIRRPARRSIAGLRWPSVSLRRRDLDRVAHGVLDREAPVADPQRFSVQGVYSGHPRPPNRAPELLRGAFEPPGGRRTRSALPTQLASPTSDLVWARVNGDRDLEIADQVPNCPLLRGEVDLRESEPFGVEPACGLQFGAVEVEEGPDAGTVSEGRTPDLEYAMKLVTAGGPVATRRGCDNRVRVRGTAGRCGGRRAPTAPVHLEGPSDRRGTLRHGFGAVRGRSRARRGQIEDSGGARRVAEPKGPALSDEHMREV